MKPSVYTRPNKPHQVRRKNREPLVASGGAATLPRPLAVDRNSECHVTPPGVARRMVQYAGSTRGTALEPEAGTGNLIHAMIEAGYPPEKITGIERHTGLAEALHRRFENVGLTLVNRCFLDWSTEVQVRPSSRYQRIVMNPPFSKARQHIEAALTLLDDQAGGVLVALVPVTFEHQEAETLARLDNTTFSTAAVYTKIIRIQRAM